MTIKVKEVDELHNVDKYKPRTVCICGSTKFKDDIMAIAREQTLRGRIVVMPLVFPHSGDAITEAQKYELDKLHLWKIKQSSLVLIVCKDFYIGQSVIREMKYAFDRGIVIQVFNNTQFSQGYHKSNYKSFEKLMSRFSEASQKIYNDLVLSGALPDPHVYGTTYTKGTM